MPLLADFFSGLLVRLEWQNVGSFILKRPCSLVSINPIASPSGSACRLTDATSVVGVSVQPSVPVAPTEGWYRRWRAMRARPPMGLTAGNGSAIHTWSSNDAKGMFAFPQADNRPGCSFCVDSGHSTHQVCMLAGVRAILSQFARQDGRPGTASSLSTSWSCS